jgi:probable rRNA maturation factor
MNIYIKNSQRVIRLNLRRIQKELNQALRLLELHTAELSVFFVGSRRMRRLNACYRGIDRLTDVLSFPMYDGGAGNAAGVLGDIVICIPKAAAQARQYRTGINDELRRLLVHGLLHLLGYDHEKNASQRQKMEKKERELLNALKTVA